jgi:hypothetical protein
MPKARPPFDLPRYQALKAQGLSQRAIAKEMAMPEPTLRNNLKVLADAIAKGLPQGDQGLPQQDDSSVHQGTPEVHQAGIPNVDQGPPEEASLGLPMGDQGPPPLYVHPGVPDDSEESVVGDEDVAEVHQGIPALPLAGIQEDHQGPPGPGLRPQLVEALTVAWPELQQMLDWWRTRQQHLHEPPEKLERVTYHVAPKWIEAVRREADLSGESYAAVVNRAFAQYFVGRST